MTFQRVIAGSFPVIDSESSTNARVIGATLLKETGSSTNALTASALTDSAPTIGAPALLSLPIFQVGSHVLDYGLNDFTNATAIHVCSQCITQYSDIAVYTLGNYASPTWSGPAAGSPTGRKITSSAISAGVVTNTGTAIGWAVIDGVNSRLMATGPLAAPVALTSGHNFSLDAIAIHYPQ